MDTIDPISPALPPKPGRPIEYTEERIKDLADGLRAFMDKPDNFWLKDYALQMGMDPARLSELAEKDDYFSQAYRWAKAMQESKLAKSGLKGKFNAQMTKFALTNVAGWREQGQIDVTSGGNPLGYVALPAIDAIDAEVIEE